MVDLVEPYSYLEIAEASVEIEVISPKNFR